ncbi:MAG TPA: flagellar protein [Cyanobacteria bacterium UBA8530]|nr:flagellar protein [Cyanobacteria bacterium UBA8530]
MSIANCPRCNKIFRKSAGVMICQACLDAEEGDFQKVYAFLKENLSATVSEIQFATEVEEKLILKFLQDGRLAGTGAKLSPNCQGCGGAISSGRFCMNCLQKKRDQLINPVADRPEKNPDIGLPAAKDDGGVRHQLRTEKYLRDR